MQLLRHINPYTSMWSQRCIYKHVAEIYFNQHFLNIKLCQVLPQTLSRRTQFLPSGNWMSRLTLVLWRSKLHSIIKFKFTFSLRDTAPCCSPSSAYCHILYPPLICVLTGGPVQGPRLIWNKISQSVFNKGPGLWSSSTHYSFYQRSTFFISTLMFPRLCSKETYWT